MHSCTTCIGRRQRRPSSRQIRLANMVLGQEPTVIAWLPTRCTTSTRCTRRNSSTARRTVTWHSCRVSSLAQSISSAHIHKSYTKKHNNIYIYNNNKAKSTRPAFFYFSLDFFFHFVPSGEDEEDGVEGLEEGGAAWRGVSSGSSQSAALSGASGALLALLSWSLFGQLVSQLAAIATKQQQQQLPMRAAPATEAASQKEQQQRQSLRVPLQVQSCSGNATDASKACSRCIRQLTWFNCPATLVPQFGKEERKPE